MRFALGPVYTFFGGVAGILIIRLLFIPFQRESSRLLSNGQW
ncbi:MAG: hypothetical protein ABR880_20855 [Candidatus Sulfotelmatobacter sp.]|jgi:hypothetical protein